MTIDLFAHFCKVSGINKLLLFKKKNTHTFVIVLNKHFKLLVLV